MTLVIFAVGVAISVVINPFVQYYFYNSVFPSSTQASAIFTEMKNDIGGLLLSCVIGTGLALATILIMRFGRYVATFIALLEQIAIYTGLSLLSTWIMWKHNPTQNTTILTILPYFIYQLAAFFTLEIAAMFGQGGRHAYNFVSIGCLVGAMIGIVRSIDQNYFVVIGTIILDTELGIAFAHSALDTVFFFGSCALASACIARSKIGGSVLWHILAFVLPLGLACAFGTYTIIANMIPVISSDVARYIVASLIAVITVLFAIAVASPMRKKVAVQSVSQKRATPINTAYVVGVPVAANAVVMV